MFAPKYRDAACRDVAAWLKRPQLPFRRPELWTDDSFRDRAQDIERMINGLSHDPRFEAPQFDWSAVGLAGHSLGGYTVMGLAGAWPSWKDNRVKAVLAMSPYAYPFVQRHTLSQSRVLAQSEAQSILARITMVEAHRQDAAAIAAIHLTARRQAMSYLRLAHTDDETRAKAKPQPSLCATRLAGLGVWAQHFLPSRRL